ncbi:hypothetical protein GGI20_002293 [Coemansia sp. BCRC 34301]|nr:hypothetical protein GGI20_002293 [Coemansia sp. BCRC 34301]
MYDSALHGNHSHSTPATPSAYSSTQPTEGKTPYDRELASLFRATAANVTQLYKEASDIGQSAYKAGYEQCYSDIWEFLAAAHQPELLLAGGEGQQVAMQRLIEFARLKRLAPPRTVQFGAVGTSGGGGGRMLPGQVHGQQDQQSTGAQDQAVNVPALAKPLGDQQLETFQKSSVMTPALRRAASAAGDGAASLCTSDLYASGSQSGSGGQRLLRGKRSLDPFDLMDIEPPRRRQRKDDIEMT